MSPCFLPFSDLASRERSEKKLLVLGGHFDYCTNPSPCLLPSCSLYAHSHPTQAEGGRICGNQSSR
ncbi:hypothetical protein E2320_021905, partial [Naja naja]